MHNLALPKDFDSLDNYKPIIKSAKEYYNCTCGITVNKYNRAQHRKTIKHRKLVNEQKIKYPNDTYKHLKIKF